MYVVKQDGAFAGYADSIVLIRLQSNGCYVPCKEAEAEGFCAKMAVTITDEKWPREENGYWKNRLRTASTERLEKIYQEKFGGTPCM